MRRRGAARSQRARVKLLAFVPDVLGMRTQQLRRIGASALAALILATAMPASAGDDDAEKAGRSVGQAARTTTRSIGHATRDVVKAIGHTTRDIVRGIGRGLRGEGKKDSN